MGIIYVLISLFLFSLSFALFANVGSVDDSYRQKTAACENAPESVDKSVSRDINPANVLANLDVLVDSGRNESSKGSSEAIQ